MSREVTVNYIDASEYDFIPDTKERKRMQAMAKDPKWMHQSIISHMCTAWARNRLQEGDRLFLEHDGVRVGSAEMIVVPGTEPKLHIKVAAPVALKEVDLKIQLVRKFDR
jgi:hypothetical protein